MIAHRKLAQLSSEILHPAAGRADTETHSQTTGRAWVFSGTVEEQEVREVK